MGTHPNLGAVAGINAEMAGTKANAVTIFMVNERIMTLLDWKSATRRRGGRGTNNKKDKAGGRQRSDDDRVVSKYFIYVINFLFLIINQYISIFQS